MNREGYIAVGADGILAAANTHDELDQVMAWQHWDVPYEARKVSDLSLLTSTDIEELLRSQCVLLEEPVAVPLGNPAAISV